MRYLDVIGPKLNERIMATLAAFELLIVRYKDLIKIGRKTTPAANLPSTCPLCKLYRKTHCRLCPWRVYEGQDYCGAAAKISPKENLKRVRRWKRRLLKEIQKGLLD